MRAIWPTIIEFGKKAEHLRSERETAIRQRKIEALRKIFQCTRCMVKCAKCGAQIDSQADECTQVCRSIQFLQVLPARIRRIPGQGRRKPGRFRLLLA